MLEIEFITSDIFNKVSLNRYYTWEHI